MNVMFETSCPAAAATMYPHPARKSGLVIDSSKSKPRPHRRDGPARQDVYIRDRQTSAVRPASPLNAPLGWGHVCIIYIFIHHLDGSTVYITKI